MDDQPSLAPLVRQLRSELGLSQRAFGERVGTSGPTVAAYEGGTKEPRWSTVQRMADVAGVAVDVTVRPGPADARRERRNRRRRALAAAAAAAIEADWPTAARLAEENLERMRVDAPPSARRWIDAWTELVGRGPLPVRRQLLADGDEADDLRQMSPFAGILSESEHRTALAVAAALP